MCLNCRGGALCRGGLSSEELEPVVEILKLAKALGDRLVLR
jgi:hypothetical protein